MRYMLGIDVGTSGTKTALFNEMGKTISSVTVGYKIIQPQVGWAEQNPEDWWQATKNGIINVINKSKVNSKDIKSIGLTGQMHGLVLLNSKGEVLRNAIIWCDQRTDNECKELTNQFELKKLICITGNPAMTGFTLSKLMWIKKNEPDVYRKSDKLLLPKDYIRYKLTGVFATEVSDASGTQMLDINSRKWSNELLDELDISNDILPPVYESTYVTGTLKSNVAKEIGLNIDTSVVGGAGDQAAAAIGNGIYKEGIISTSIGTSGVVFAATNKPVLDKLGRVHTLCHAVPGMWNVMGVTQSAGLSLKWFKENFCSDVVDKATKTSKNVYDLLSDMASHSKPGANGIIYLPYLMGERSPHLNPKAKGMFFGFTHANTKDDFIRSILEGVSFSLKNCLDIMLNMNINLEEIRVCGGGAESIVWKQILSDIFEYPLFTLRTTEGPALGAAILASVGAGIYESIEDACNLILHCQNKITPNPLNYSAYSKAYAKYNHMYPAVKEFF
ncbi:xylulokinase [Clostridium sp. JN-1]|uniref:xylulokinase n=1 Tax=Clostridium sp. JN-1 TaxID=2483110 RepID=UPI000F0B4AB1|nr:xylulokinase [Clostridium sp. JN-1]